MRFSDIELAHIVDVDGQLLGIDAEVVDAVELLSRAGRPIDSDLWLVRAGERLAVAPWHEVRLSADDVLFFETTTSTKRSIPSPLRLAA